MPVIISAPVRGSRRFKAKVVTCGSPLHGGWNSARKVRISSAGRLARSVVDSVRCAIEVQNAMVERNAGVPPERLIVFRIETHLGDVIEESDGDLMGDGINIAARRSEGHRPTFTDN
jgi:class 3 adenylate cyclase